VPGSGLVSMEQAAVLMMQQVLAAELGDSQRLFALVLGPVNTRVAESADPQWVRPEQVGAVAVAASASTAGSREIRLRDQAEVAAALAQLQDDQRAEAGSR
jgi:NAD(P)-dependent dehydrogenase (short-subunit alcohol dehydrogenase family)